MNDTTIVALKNVNKSYTIGSETLQVLQKINLSVQRGDYLAILGASGSGKSTLMNLLGCMDSADSGDYLLDGANVSQYTDAELTVLRNQKIGFIFQRYHLIPQYTVLENVLLPLLIRGLHRSEALPIAEKYIRLVGLTDRILHKPRELSGGQQQRVAIARALVTSPSLLLADEPTGALDSRTGIDILSLFEKLNNMGNTIIMITHDSNVARRSKQIVHLSDGILSY